MDGFEDSSVATRPQWSVGQAAELARERYGLDGEATELPSERDQNFKIATADGETFVLKISNPAEDRRILELQDAALRHLRSDGVDRGTPEPIPAGGETILAADGADGTSHHVRLLSWVPGEPLAKIRDHDGLLEPIGHFLAELDRRLAGFEHPAAEREFYWDLRCGLDVAKRYAPEIADPGRRKRVDRWIAGIAEHRRLLESLPRQVIQGYANDYNILIDRMVAEPTIGLIDFGDMGRSWRVADLAILLAYAMLHKTDSLSVAARIVGAYHGVLPLDENEIEALFPLVRLRLCTSVALAAYHRRRAPDNTYLTVTENPAWELLDALDAVDSKQALDMFCKETS